MKQILVISGKGGTGKTILTASFASLAENKVMVDCDVDAADLYILLHPEIKQRSEFKGSKIAVIDYKKCDSGYKCDAVCRFDAIHKARIDTTSCEGCGVCVEFCHAKAINMQERIDGEWFISETKYGPLVHAKLGIARPNSGKLVTLVRNNAREIAEIKKHDFIIIDGPPGIGCPVIASLSGVDLAVIVTEPTYSGIHDMERVIDTAKHFGIAVGVCINKYDINLENTLKIEDYCHKNNLPVLGKIPFDTVVTKSLVQRAPVVEFSENGVVDEIKKIWDKVVALLHP
jgi:MinD superfamily P-loop ATPase